MGSDPILYSVPIVSPGHFRLKAYEGVRIALQACIDRDKDKRIESDPVQIPETGEYKNLRLVISSP
jgi:hypothetical protein